MRSNPVYGKSLLIVKGHKIHFQKYPYNVEENECELLRFFFRLSILQMNR